MSQADVDLVARLYVASAGPEGGSFDVARLIEDPGWQREVEGLFTPDTHIKFVTPPVGDLRVMDPDEFHGLSGLVEGWQVWMRPWESFEIEIEDLVDGGDGQVLFLARATARIRDSGTEITQETGALHRVEAGKIASIHYYLDQAQARQAAGLS